MYLITIQIWTTGVLIEIQTAAIISTGVTFAHWPSQFERWIKRSEQWKADCPPT